jgi:hypothetical protein
MKYRFTAIKGPRRYPLVGELIRNSNTGSFINIVLEVSEESLHQTCKGHSDPKPGAHIRSVRYGDCNKGDFKLLSGTRSRSFVWFNSELRWQIVEQRVLKEVVTQQWTVIDNTADRLARVKELEGVETAYRPG